VVGGLLVQENIYYKIRCTIFIYKSYIVLLSINSGSQTSNQHDILVTGLQVIIAECWWFQLLQSCDRKWITWSRGVKTNICIWLATLAWLLISRIWNFVSIFNRSRVTQRFLLRKIGHETKNWVTWPRAVKMNISIWSAILDFLLAVFGILSVSVAVL